MQQRIEFTSWQVVALTAVLLLAFAANIGMPYNIDAIALSFDISNARAGLVASMELAAIAGGNLLLARLAGKLNQHRVYFFGALGIVACNALSMFTNSITELLLLRVPAGFALGAVAATVMATAARSAKPEMTFGVINSMVGVLGMALGFLMPRALAMHLFANEHPALNWSVWNEMDGLFVVYALFSLGALLFIRHTPAPAPAAPPSQGQAAAKSIGIGWLALFGLGFIFHGHGNLALFLVILGREASLEVEVVGYVLMVGAGIGIGLPLLTGYIGGRIKPLAPMLVVVLLITLSALVLANLNQPSAYMLSAPLFAVLPMALMPIMLGVLARMDPSGALAGSHPAFVLIAGAAAPFVGGAISDASGGFAATGWFAVACFWLGFGLCWPVLRRAQRAAAPANQPTDAPSEAGD